MESIPLYGRDADLEIVIEFATDTPLRPASALVVVGDAGIGKSVLLDAVVSAAEDAGLRVVRADGVEYGADLVFGGLSLVLFPLLDRLPSLTAAHREAVGVICGLEAGPPPDQVIASAAALALVRSASAEAPLLVVIDDAPLLDLASAMAVAYVARRVDPSDVRFLFSARTDTENAFVRSGFDVYPLHQLSDRSADELLRARFPGLASDARARIRAAAHGNPLALLDLPSFFEVEVESLPDVVPLAQRLVTHYSQQLLPLPLGTRELLLFVVLGGADGSATIEQLIARAENQGELAPAERAGLVVSDRRSGRVQFRHPLIRAAVYESSTTDERQQTHAVLAEAFRDDPRRRAWHLSGSAVGLDAAVADDLETAADELLATGDARQAVTAILRSAELTHHQPARVQRIARAAYIASLVTGDLHFSEQLLLEASATPQVSVQLGSVIALSHRLVNRAGDAANAHRLLMTALHATPGALDANDPLTMEALQTLVIVSYVGGTADFWADTRGEMSRVRPVLPQTLALFRDLFSYSPSPDRGAMERLDLALAHLSFTADPVQITRVARAGSHLDRVRAAHEALARVVDDAREGGAKARQIQALFLLSVEDFFSGEWDQLASHTQHGLALCDELGYALQAMLGRYLRALGEVVQGSDLLVGRTVEELLQWAAPRGLYTLAARASHLQCLRALGRGEFDEAYRHAASITQPGQIQAFNQTAFWTILDLVEAAVRSGHAQEAAEHVAAMVEAKVAWLSARLEMVVRATEAMVSKEGWRELFDEALSTPDGALFPFDQARICLAYGERLRRERVHKEARVQLARAAAAFRRLRASPWLERADRELVAAGGSPPESEAGALTPQELAVAQLVSAGLTNKQVASRMFISPRTVSTHLSRVFAKLDVTTRHDLAGALRQSGDVPQRTDLA